MSVARHDDLPERADEDSLRRLDKFAVDLRGYPYDKDEIAKIVAQTIGNYKEYLRTWLFPTWVSSPRLGILHHSGQREKIHQEQPCEFL